MAGRAAAASAEEVEARESRSWQDRLRPSNILAASFACPTTQTQPNGFVRLGLHKNSLVPPAGDSPAHRFAASLRF